MLGDLIEASQVLLLPTINEHIQRPHLVLPPIIDSGSDRSLDVGGADELGVAVGLGGKVDQLELV
jgi:hypothetical protein